MSRLAALFLVVVGGVAFAGPSEPPASPAKTEEPAQAAPAKSSKFPLRVVKILSDSAQALLFDSGRHRHVLVEVGDSVGDYTIATITEDGVTLKGKDVPVEVELASPDKKAPATKAEAKPVAKQEAKPEAKPETKPEAAPAKDAPADPYTPAEEAPKKEAPKSEPTSEVDGAPSDPYAEAEGKDDETVVATHWGAPPPVEVEKPEPPKATEPTKLAKKEVNAALLDFTVLVGSIDGTFMAQGLKLEKVKAGSIFAKAGLLAGDVVVSVDGQPMKSIDDAADLYARAGGMKQSNVQILRGGKPQMLRVSIL